MKMKATECKILLVDDDADFVEILQTWLLRSGYRVDHAFDGRQALEAMKHEGYAVVLTDLMMPGWNGHQLLYLLKQQAPTVPVIFLSGQGTMEDAILALKEGKAFDFIIKPIHDLPMLNAVIERALAHRQEPKPQRFTQLPEGVEELSERECEVITFLARGMDNRQIGDALCISEKTVKNHLTRIYEKLKVSNRTQAVLLCQKLGLLAG